MQMATQSTSAYIAVRQPVYKGHNRKIEQSKQLKFKVR